MNIPDGTGKHFEEDASDMERECHLAFRADEGTWRHLMRKSVYFALAQSEPHSLKDALISLRTLANEWITDIEGR